MAKVKAEKKSLASYIFMWPERFAGITWESDEDRERSLTELVMGYPCENFIFTLWVIDPSTSHLKPRLTTRHARLARINIVGNLPPFFLWQDCSKQGEWFQAGVDQIMAIQQG